MVLAATTIPPSIESLASVIGGVIDTLRVLVGGIFGLYIIVLIFKWVEYKRLVKIITDMRKELRELNGNLKSKKKKR
jgi:hypothetical protein